MLLAETLHWLNQQINVKVLMLQETHWSDSRDWAADGWFFCHSASPKPRSGGLLIALKQDSFDHSSIRWQELIPGRLLHVRAYAGQQHLDLVNVYQHALPFDGDLSLRRC